MKPRSNAAGARAEHIRRAAWLVCVVIWLFPTAARAQAEAVTKRVLVVTSYDMNLPGVVSFHHAMRASMREGSDARVEFFYEFQENTRIPIDEYEDYIVSYLQHKHAGEKFDLGIALGGPR